jgi:dTDP-4-dehydrorhamnose reductase
MGAPELWGGLECTVNRVQDKFHNQLQRSGHDARLCDLDRIAELGIRRLRYPVLWELTAPHAPDECKWHWPDLRLARLRELNIDPVVGLVHHGSGPRYTNLLDERFPALLAGYARSVAERYPWVHKYTPINEPLTTARFCALYGHWYPHRHDDRSFVRALINQCRAVVLAMREIRGVNSAAELIQTDDIGFTTSTPKLAYQAQFDNERRWLAWDFLCGKVTSQHLLWKYLRTHGLSDGDYRFFQEHPCPPDVIGVNHYVTSDRHLSEHRKLFARHTWGGNGRHQYADIEAVRALAEPTSGFSGALLDAWRRYRLPLAITEAHLGCTREEQLRWLWQAWTQAHQLRSSGIDVRAVTAWALLGSFDWNRLLTVDAGHYETGAFDVRGSVPRPTAVARLITALATGTQFQPAALLRQPGWWQRPVRMFPSLQSTHVGAEQAASQPVLVVSECETLRDALHEACEHRGLSVRVCPSLRLDAQSADVLLEDVAPWGVVEVAAPESGTLLAAACLKRGIPLLTFPSLHDIATMQASMPDLIGAALDTLIDEATEPEGRRIRQTRARGLCDALADSTTSDRLAGPATC